jgi:hypothetical protein
MVRQVADQMTAETLHGCGHFMTEERPEFVVRDIPVLTEMTALVGDA